jgi:hypothetical protein
MEAMATLLDRTTVNPAICHGKLTIRILIKIPFLLSRPEGAW